MLYWRETASQQCQDDLDGLLDMTLQFARQMLETHGEFYPFGAAMSTDGQPGYLAADPGENDHPDKVEVLALMVGGLRDNRALYRAVAMCSDVRLHRAVDVNSSDVLLPDSDAVRFELEHQEGVALAVFLPYKKKRFGRGVEYGEFRAVTADRQVWS